MAKYIDGIFNYCDRWCERCPFTSRCRSFSMGEAIQRRARRKDAENEAFWRAMDKACGDALADVTRQAESLTPDESDDERVEKAALRRKTDEHDARVRAHPLAKLADEVLWTAHRWLERRRGRVPGAVADAVEVIAWYHMFIGVKLTRALSGLVDDEEGDEDGDEPEDLLDEHGVPCPKDCDGSAKVAIIAVERSFAAWSLVRDRAPAELKNAAKMMTKLLRVRAVASQTFPDARTFYRPGFDDVGSRD